MFESILSNPLGALFSIVGILVVLSILVFVHEFGHFFVAKKLGIGVEEFGFGLPPRAWGKKIRGTIYSVNWLPLGGFVRLTGEDVDGDERSKIKDKKELKKYFWSRSKLERSMVLLAGVFMNFVLAVVILSFLFIQGLDIAEGVAIKTIREGSPAAEVFVTGDKIVKIEDKPMRSIIEVSSFVSQNKGKPISVTVSRGEGVGPTEFTFTVTPRENPPEGEGALGIEMEQLFVTLKYPWYQAPFYGVVWGFRFSYEMFTALAGLLWKLVTFQITKADAEQISGPLGVAVILSDALKQGIVAVAKITGIISLNLAMFNILPIPALDGGRLFFVLTENWISKKIKPRAEAAVHQIGLVILLLLAALITINDFLRLRG